MNSSTQSERRAQVNTLLSGEKYFVANGLMTVQLNVINKQFKVAIFKIIKKRKENFELHWIV